MQELQICLEIQIQLVVNLQEKYSWESVDYKHDYKIDFGEYVQVYAENNITNINMKARTLV